MAYRFARGDAGIEAALRRIAAEQLDGALAALDGADADLERSVHGVRTATKRIRALLRLLRAVFPGYSEANAALRTLAARLADVREAQVLLATFDSVAGESGGKTLAAFRAELEADEAAAALRVRGAVLEDARARLLALRAASRTTAFRFACFTTSIPGSPRVARCWGGSAIFSASSTTFARSRRGSTIARRRRSGVSKRRRSNGVTCSKKKR